MAGETVTIENFPLAHLRPSEPGSFVTIKIQSDGTSSQTEDVWYWRHGEAIAYALTTAPMESFGVPGSTVSVSIG